VVHPTWVIDPCLQWHEGTLSNLGCFFNLYIYGSPSLSFPTVGERSWPGPLQEKPCFTIRTQPSKRRSDHGCNVKPVDDKEWEDIVRRLLQLEKIFGLGIGKENSHLTLRIDGKTESLTPEQFLRVIPPKPTNAYKPYRMRASQPHVTGQPRYRRRRGYATRDSLPASGQQSTK
jgi:hypothetical protein